jgi:hypothetical protein
VLGYVWLGRQIESLAVDKQASAQSADARSGGL